MSITILNSLAESRTPFGGEGLFYATLRGPGTVYIQSLPSADSLTELLLQHPKQEEVVKEAYWWLGNLLDGDNRY
jgi:uncharacterized protein (AIM24 family)